MYKRIIICKMLDIYEKIDYISIDWNSGLEVTHLFLWKIVLESEQILFYFLLNIFFNLLIITKIFYISSAALNDKDAALHSLNLYFILYFSLFRAF